MKIKSLTTLRASLTGCTLLLVTLAFGEPPPCTESTKKESVAQAKESVNPSTRHTGREAWEDAPERDDTIGFPETLASFPGGEDSLRTFYHRNLIAPSECREISIEGRVIVQLKIEESGEVSEIKILRCPDPAIAQEVRRVTGLMPRWEPARTFGKPVVSYFIFPVRFKF